MIHFYQTLRKGCSCMFKRAALLLPSMLLLLSCMIMQVCIAQEEPDVNGIPGYKGMSMKGNWRPFNNHSYWNKPIPVDAQTHTDSAAIINELTVRNYPKEIFLRLGEEWNPTLHVVGSQASKFYYQSRSDILENGVKVGVRHGRIYRFTHFNLQNCWNPDADNIDNQDVTDEAWPFIPAVTYPAKVDDGLMIVVDKSAGNKFTSYEVSHGHDYLNTDGYAQCTTFNIWNLGYNGIVTYRPLCSSATSGSSGGGGASCASCDDYWQHAGGHGAGTSLIAGLIRPEELDNALDAPLSPEDPNYNPDVATGDGLIHHALKFSYDQNRKGAPLYPFAYRNDGTMIPTADLSRKYPVEGMLFQLMDPNNEIEDSISNPYAKVIVRTLKTYGMVLVDNGSNGYSMALYLQNMYTPNNDLATNRVWWDSHYQNIYDGLTGPNPYNNTPKIRASHFRVVDTENLYLSHYLSDHINND